MSYSTNVDETCDHSSPTTGFFVLISIKTHSRRQIATSRCRVRKCARTASDVHQDRPPQCAGDVYAAKASGLVLECPQISEPEKVQRGERAGAALGPRCKAAFKQAAVGHPRCQSYCPGSPIQQVAECSTPPSLLDVLALPNSACQHYCHAPAH